MSQTTDNHRLVPYSEARGQIRDADLLLWRPTSWDGWIIAQLTRSEHCHASKAAWEASRLMTLGTEGGKGGIAEPLSEQVAKYPGIIDVYEVNPEGRWHGYDRAASIAWTRNHVVGQKYGWWATIRSGLSRVIVLRWFPYFSPNRDDEANGTKPPNCSAACSMSDRLGGNVDPVENLSDLATEPGDLARSPFYKYRFTLTPDSGQED